MRDYHVKITVPAHDAGDEMLAGRLKLVVDGEVVSEAKVLATWSEDEHLTTRKDRRVAESELRNELADVTREAFEARAAGDTDRETEKIRRATEIATTLEDDEKLALYSRLTEIDPVTGQVVRKATIDPLDEIEAATRSVKTNRTRPPGS